MRDADNTAKKQRGRPFAKGQSGNQSGRPAGSRNKATLAAETLLDGEAETLTRTAIEKAKQGDMAALRLCLDRILPPRKDRPTTFDLPVLQNTEDAPKALAAIATAVARGDLSISEAAEFCRIVEAYVRTIEATDLERRLRSIEATMK
jgi:hypothetical protein